jgi:hypothetical protein
MRSADHQHVRRARVLFCQPGVRIQDIDRVSPAASTGSFSRAAYIASSNPAASSRADSRSLARSTNPGGHGHAEQHAEQHAEPTTPAFPACTTPHAQGKPEAATLRNDLI